MPLGFEVVWRHHFRGTVGFVGHGTEVATHLLVFSGCYPSSPLVFDVHLMRVCEDLFYICHFETSLKCDRKFPPESWTRSSLKNLQDAEYGNGIGKICKWFRRVKLNLSFSWSQYYVGSTRAGNPYKPSFVTVTGWRTPLKLILTHPTYHVCNSLKLQFVSQPYAC